MDLTFIGLEPRDGGASAELLAKGKRRTVTYLAFLSFVFVVAGLDATDWVAGTSVFQGDISSADAKFHLGLLYFSSEFTRTGISGLVYTTSTSTAIADQLTQINFAINNPQNDQVSNSQFYSLFAQANIKPISPTVFSSTIGLLAFAASLTTIAWLCMAAIQYDMPMHALVAKNIMLTVRVCLSLATFFTFVSILVFAASPVKGDFCTALDPGANANGQYCRYGVGFGLTITGLVFLILSTLLAWRWMPADFGARYEFNGAAGGSGGLVKGGFSNAESAVVVSSGGSGSGYQDIVSN